MNFRKRLELDKQLVEEELKRFLNQKLPQTSVDSIQRKNDFLRAYVLADAKRLRPALILEAYRACHKDIDPRIVKASLSVELLHNSTLVHDDIMDEDWYRRGQPSINHRLADEFLGEHRETQAHGKIFANSSSKYIVSNAILIGDVLQTLSLDALIEAGMDPRATGIALSTLSHAYNVVINGQYLDLDFENTQSITQGDYILMVKYKTAYLFRAAIQIGAILAGETDQRIDTLGNFGLSAGIAFQLQDDIMDITKDSGKGHDYGSDIRSGKMTLLTIKTLQDAQEIDKERILAILGNQNATSKDIDDAVAIMKKCGSLDYSRTLALDKIVRAKQSIQSLSLYPEGEEFFVGFADYMINRLK